MFEKAEEYFVRALARDPGHVCWYARQLAMYYGSTLDGATAGAERDIDGMFKEGHCKRHAVALVAGVYAWLRAARRHRLLGSLHRWRGQVHNLSRHAALAEAGKAGERRGYARALSAALALWEGTLTASLALAALLCCTWLLAAAVGIALTRMCVLLCGPLYSLMPEHTLPDIVNKALVRGGSTVRVASAHNRQARRRLKREK